MATQPNVLPFYSLQGGATPQTRGEAQAFARRLLNSQAYRTSLEDRIKDKKLAPQIEALLWHYAYGKPIEQVQVNVTQGDDLTGLPLDELYKRTAALAHQLEEASALAAAIPADVLK